MISKNARQAKILEAVGKRPVRSQKELSSLLKREGVRVTQSTLSRDIRELGLVKVRGEYQISGAVRSAPPTIMRRAFAQLWSGQGFQAIS
jgi:transcriptional regulator of arginine metabolism